jgi:dTDP-4-dehydrorhamnose reductase
MADLVPDSVRPTFASRGHGYELTDFDVVQELIADNRPDVVVNLAGESRPDVVEKDPDASYRINVGMPHALAYYSQAAKYRLIQISTQAVFDGLEAPYAVNGRCNPINEYGKQKLTAETLCSYYQNVTVIRPTFVLGIRPNPDVGRPNPVELILGGQNKQVNDRWFSPSFAPDVARVIWNEVVEPSRRNLIFAGVPMRTNRYLIAKALGVDAEPVSHESFPGIAPRPFDTTYAVGDHFMSFDEGIADCLRLWHAREAVAA